MARFNPRQLHPSNPEVFRNRVVQTYQTGGFRFRREEILYWHVHDLIGNEKFLKHASDKELGFVRDMLHRGGPRTSGMAGWLFGLWDRYAKAFSPSWADRGKAEEEHEDSHGSG
jgi:hypothetical protein